METEKILRRFAIQQKIPEHVDRERLADAFAGAQAVRRAVDGAGLLDLTAPQAHALLKGCWEIFMDGGAWGVEAALARLAEPSEWARFNAQTRDDGTEVH